jgi:predicted RNA-binding protein with PUA-like domain
MQYWLLKTEPETFSFDDLTACGAAGDTWDGVRNHQAAGFLREMAVGDQGLCYHSGRERRVVGTFEVIRASYPDPTDASGRFVAVTVRALERLPQPVSLTTIKAQPELADFALVRQPRLSVMPVSASTWRAVLRLAGA